jgi:hypothetical protein
VRVEAGVRCDEEVRFHLPLHLIRDPKISIPRQVYENFLGLRNAISLVVAFHDTLRCGISSASSALPAPFIDLLSLLLVPCPCVSNAL